MVKTALRTATFEALAVLIGLSALGVRAYLAVSAADVVEWDETYYASSTATAAAGIGRFPYVLGYPEIPNMGGIGYAIYAYVASYQLFGGTLLSLRVVALLASAAGAVGAAVLTGRVFGRPAGLVAFAVTPALLIFHSVNSIRMDGMAFALVAWGLVTFAWAADRNTFGRNFLVGLVFALGLNVHLHTAAAAFAVGLAYLRNAFGTARAMSGPRQALMPLGSFGGGYLAGAALFLAISVLPSPASYFRTAALARLSAVDSDKRLNLAAPMDESKLAASFLSPREIVPKEATRYRSMFLGMPRWERALWLIGVPLLLLRRSGPNEFPSRALLPGAVIGGGILLNSAAPLYFAPLVPFFVPAAATLVTHGLSGGRRRDVGTGSLIALALLGAAVGVTTWKRATDAKAIVSATRETARPDWIDSVVQTTSPGCVLAGPTNLYARYFMAYPRFIGTGEGEVLIGSTYLDLQHDPVAYWATKQPDIVLGVTDAGLTTFLAREGYERIGEQIWRRPALRPGCTVSAP